MATKKVKVTEVIRENIDKNAYEILGILKRKGHITNIKCVKRLLTGEKNKIDSYVAMNIASSPITSMDKLVVINRILSDKNKELKGKLELSENAKEEWEKALEKMKRETEKFVTERDNKNHENIQVIMKLNKEVKELEEKLKLEKVRNKEINDNMIKLSTKISDLQGELNEAVENTTSRFKEAFSDYLNNGAHGMNRDNRELLEPDSNSVFLQHIPRIGVNSKSEISDDRYIDGFKAGTKFGLDIGLNK